MGSRRSHKNPPVVTRESESEEDVQSSQEEDGGVIMKAAQNLMSSSKNQREKKRKTLEGQHEKRIKELNVKIDTAFENRKNRVTKSQQAVWDRLEALNKKRQTLEHHILASMKIIELHTKNIASELNAVLEGRIEEIFSHAKAQELKG